MITRIAKLLVLGVLATVGGMVLQCSSDRAITGDGGVIDTWLADLGIRDQGQPDRQVRDHLIDGIGPKADAADSSTPTTGLKKVVFSGNIAPGAKTTHCDPVWVKSPPSVTLWTKNPNPSYPWYFKDSSSFFVKILEGLQGCIQIESSSGNTYEYNLVVVY